MDRLIALLRTSEFWLAIGAAVGTALVNIGVIPQEQWDSVFWPMIVYVIGRFVSKAAKAVIK
jgi:hypothetical protein